MVEWISLICDRWFMNNFVVKAYPTTGLHQLMDAAAGVIAGRWRGLEVECLCLSVGQESFVIMTAETAPAPMLPCQMQMSICLATSDALTFRSYLCRPLGPCSRLLYPYRFLPSPVALTSCAYSACFSTFSSSAAGNPFFVIIIIIFVYWR